jgi:hypothetical protein
MPPCTRTAATMMPLLISQDTQAQDPPTGTASSTTFQSRKVNRLMERKVCCRCPLQAWMDSELDFGAQMNPRNRLASHKRSHHSQASSPRNQKARFVRTITYVLCLLVRTLQLKYTRRNDARLVYASGLESKRESRSGSQTRIKPRLDSGSVVGSLICVVCYVALRVARCYERISPDFLSDARCRNAIVVYALHPEIKMS